MKTTSDYMRDERTGALINNDVAALDKAKKLKKNKINTEIRIETLEMELSELKLEMNKLKELLRIQ